MGDAPMDPAGVSATLLGVPRIGPDRELKFALERHWRGEIDRAELERAAASARRASLAPAVAAGLDRVPSGDQALYDHVLDMVLALGLVPPRLAGDLDPDDPAAEFTLARGDATRRPLEMTKWFDTNYHHLVPEVGARIAPRLNAGRQLRRLEEARALGAPARPVIVGPYTLLRVARAVEPGVDPLTHLPALLPPYRELIGRLGDAGAAGVQVDEPALAVDDPGRAAPAYAALAELADTGVPITLATYFGGVEAHLERLLALPLARVHLDLVRAPAQLEPALAAVGDAGGLSLGLVDGRNVWRADLDAALALAARAVARLGAERVDIAPSCSLLHVPYSAARETGLDPELRGWLAFAEEKVGELATLRAALADPPAADDLLAEGRAATAARRRSTRVHDVGVATREAAVAARPAPGRPPFAERYPAQMRALGLPPLPTTTIGSFPQTDELRAARRRHREGAMSEGEYRALLARYVRDAVALQEDIGLDVLVHGEPERTDMVEYFGERLRGIAVTAHGWVQSYGSRCVKPPLVYGDVARPEPLTVDWWRVAQEAASRPVKGMLTGPVTILQWSYARDDIPRERVARQIALAVADEVRDLEDAGCRVIQVDEPGLREGLPPAAAERAAYLEWAVDAFRLATAGVADGTQVHTHMCYADFHDIVAAVARMDADVLSLESSRSDMGALGDFGAHYPNALGPGVYDIHSPRVPSSGEMEDLLALAEEHIARDRLWANPDCGLKTREWDQVVPALRNLVAAARRRRAAGAPAPAGR